jgi:hypothetical protein
MYISRRYEAVPAVMAFGAAALIIYALRYGVFPLDWASRVTQPIRFWLELALTAAAGAACFAWAISMILGTST